MEKLSDSLCFYSDCMRPACAIRHTRQALGYDMAVCWFHAADHERATVQKGGMKSDEESNEHRAATRSRRVLQRL